MPSISLRPFSLGDECDRNWYHDAMTNNQSPALFGFKVSLLGLPASDFPYGAQVLFSQVSCQAQFGSSFSFCLFDVGWVVS